MCVSKGIPVYKVKPKLHRTTITGDIACNSYYTVDEDVNLLKELGVRTYLIYFIITKIKIYIMIYILKLIGYSR